MIARVPPLGEDPAARRERALERLAALIELRDRGLREPLPIASFSSAAYAAGVASDGVGSEEALGAAEKAWQSGFKVPGEDAEPEMVRAFGAELTLAELMEIPPAPDEQGPGWPAEEPSRFGRCARRLWDPLLAVEAVEFA
jgi:exodeoxyribonuclease V gamma subunit